MNPNYKKIEEVFKSGEETESVLETLFELWIDQDPAYDENVQQMYEKLGEWTERMSIAESDRLTGIVVDLCIAYARKGYLDGAKTAGLLIREILSENEQKY